MNCPLCVPAGACSQAKGTTTPPSASTERRACGALHGQTSELWVSCHSVMAFAACFAQGRVEGVFIPYGVLGCVSSVGGGGPVWHFEEQGRGRFAPEEASLILWKPALRSLFRPVWELLGHPRRLHARTSRELSYLWLGRKIAGATRSFGVSTSLAQASRHRRTMMGFGSPNAGSPKSPSPARRKKSKSKSKAAVRKISAAKALAAGSKTKPVDHYGRAIEYDDEG